MEKKMVAGSDREADPLVSVIVPVYRTAAYLPACMDSLQNQTYPHLELVLVDDGSPDECPALCDAYAEQDARIRVVHKENGGLMSAWMAGVQISTGEYLAFVDSDDWVERGMIGELVKHTDKTEGRKREIICCGYLLERKHGEEPVASALPPGVYEGETLRVQVRPWLLGNSPRTVILSRCMKLFSRALIERNLFFCDMRIVMGEDVNITLPALLDCERLVLLQDAYYYHYRYLDASMVHRYDASLYENILLLDGKIRQILAAKNAPAAQEQAGREFQLLLLLEMRNELRGGGKEGIFHLRKLLLEPKLRALVRQFPPSVGRTADRLLYQGMKHPGRLQLALLRLLLQVYDGIGKG